MDLEVEPEQLLRHRRALDVPAGPALPPGTRPGGVLAGLASLPEREVERRLLELGDSRLLALVHGIGIAVGEPAVSGEAADAEIDVAARLVCMAGIDQIPDQAHDRSDRLGCPRLVVGPAEAEGVGVGDVAGDHLLRVVGRGDAGLARGRVDLVVDVGDVDDEGRRVALVLEEAAQQREDDVRSPVADVDRPVGGRPARVDPDLPLGPRLEPLQLPGQRIPDSNFPHRADPTFRSCHQRLTGAGGTGREAEDPVGAISTRASGPFRSGSSAARRGTRRRAAPCSGRGSP